MIVWIRPKRKSLYFVPPSQLATSTQEKGWKWNTCNTFKETFEWMDKIYTIICFVVQIQCYKVSSWLIRKYSKAFSCSFKLWNLIYFLLSFCSRSLSKVLLSPHCIRVLTYLINSVTKRLFCWCLLYIVHTKTT